MQEKTKTMFKEGFKVKVVGENGQVVIPNANKPEYGSIRMEQLVFNYRNGFLNKRNKVAFLAGKQEELNEFVTLMGLKPNVEIPGCLYTIERFAPFYEGQQPKLNPTTGRACLIDGAAVFQHSYYDASGTRQDEYLQGEAAEGYVIADPATLKIPAALQSLGLSDKK
jgi:hypothetical protein